MPLLKPAENIPTIITMIEKAQNFIVMVSPYTDLVGWDRLKSCLDDASKRIKVDYYVREGQGAIGLEDLKNINIFEVPMLHAKMFFSEKDAIIGSFHLKNNNDINWAYKLTGPEYKDMVDFFDSFIKPLARSVIK